MTIDGITFDPNEIESYGITVTGGGLPPVYKVTLDFWEGTRLIKDYFNKPQAQAIIDAIKAARNEIELADGVTFDKAEKRFSTKYLTVEVVKIDALFVLNSRIYVIIGNNEFQLTGENQIAIDKLAAYCPQLTKIKDYYINKEKSKGFFVEQRDLNSYCKIFLSVNKRLLYIEQFRDIIPAVNRCEELDAEYKF